jgi:preprotein translocase subunit YajC
MQALVPILLIGFMYVLLVRPQQQRVRAQRALVQSLAVGDEIVTVGGLIGHIVALDDSVATIDTGTGVSLRFRRAAISGKWVDPDTVEDDADDDDDSDAGSEH